MMMLILATTLCLVFARTQSEFLNGQRMSPYLDERKMDTRYNLIKVGMTVKLFIAWELIILSAY